jgi:hypothetical protein
MGTQALPVLGDRSTKWPAITLGVDQRLVNVTSQPTRSRRSTTKRPPSEPPTMGVFRRSNVVFHLFSRLAPIVSNSSF